MDFDLLDQPYDFHSDKWQIESMPNIVSAEYDNEYSIMTKNKEISECANFINHSEFVGKESEIEYSGRKLFDNQVLKTRLEFKDRKNANKMLVFLRNIITGGNEMIKREIDFDPEMDKIIDSIVKYGESRTSVMKRVLSYVYRDSNFYNQE